MPDKDQPESSLTQKAWEEHNLSQLRYFRSLSLRTKLEAVEGMADIVRRFEELHARRSNQIKQENDKPQD